MTNCHTKQMELPPCVLAQHISLRKEWPDQDGASGAVGEDGQRAPWSA